MNNPARYIDPSGHKACEDTNEIGSCLSVDQSNVNWENRRQSRKNDNKYHSIALASVHQDPCQTVACRASNGDIGALVDLFVPSHIGWRFQLEGTVFIFSGTAGANIVMNRVDQHLAGNLDWSLGGGPGIGAGVAVTTGPIIGWGSSRVEDVTAGNSILASGSGAAEFAGTVSIAAPISNNGLFIDPYYGQIPTTLYLGGGGGGGFADAGLSYSGTFLRHDISDWLPWTEIGR
jgi:hypothetical protein